MLILDKGYIETRNKYIHPLSDYYIQYRQLKNNNIKKMLLTKTKNIIKSADQEYIFIIDEDDLFKALLGDIFLFYIRSILQQNDFQQIEKINGISANWNIVTNYYSAFFNASLLLRLCFRGNMFIDQEYKRGLERLISNHIGEIIVLNSNQFYYIEEDSGTYRLRLTKVEYNTHEVVWQMVGKLLDEVLLFTNNRSDEKAFLLSCQMINRQLGPTFPSKLRNKINYQPMYGLEYVDKKLYPIMKNSNWVKEIMSFDKGEVKANDNRLINIYSAYTTYIRVFSYRLVQDYFEMRGMKDHILAQINKNRENKISIPDISFSY